MTKLELGHVCVGNRISLINDPKPIVCSDLGRLSRVVILKARDRGPSSLLLFVITELSMAIPEEVEGISLNAFCR